MLALILDTSPASRCHGCCLIMNVFATCVNEFRIRKPFVWLQCRDEIPRSYGWWPWSYQMPVLTPMMMMINMMMMVVKMNGDSHYRGAGEELAEQSSELPWQVWAPNETHTFYPNHGLPFLTSHQLLVLVSNSISRTWTSRTSRNRSITSIMVILNLDVIESSEILEGLEILNAPQSCQSIIEILRRYFFFQSPLKVPGWVWKFLKYLFDYSLGDLFHRSFMAICY